MATTRPFAYNLGSSIDGTEQLGNLAIGTPTSGFTQSPKFWNGPDEDLGYIIAHQTPSGQPGADGTTAYLGFWRTAVKTEESFIELSEYVSNGTETFLTGNEAKTWLNNNGYWTSYQSPLVVYLDSGNPSSYSGSGSNWVDLSGENNNATLINSPTYSSSFEGILQFDDVSLEYATIPDLGDLPQWSIEVWFRLSTPLTGKVSAIVTNEFDLVNKLNFSLGTNNAPSNRNLAVGFFDGSWHTTTGVVPQVGVWYQMVGTYDGSVVRQYVNGVASGGTVNYSGNPQSGGVVRLMRRWDETLTSSNLIDGDLAIVKIYSSYLTAGDILSSYNSTYSRFINPTPTPSSTTTPTPTPTPTLSPTNTQTPTPTVTPTNTSTTTPTPSTSPIPVTGYGFNLVVLPYNPPSSGNTIFPTFATPGLNSGTTNPNTFTTNGIYWNSIDNLGVDRTNYFSGMTGTSVTSYFTQNGNTVIYSGSSTAFTYDGSPAAFNYNPNSRAGQLVLIQSASTNFVTGQTVYISYILNN